MSSESQTDSSSGRSKSAYVHFLINMSLSFRDSEAEMLLHILDLMGISVSTGSACDSKNTQLSHVLKAIHTQIEYVNGTIRISFGYENTDEDISYIAESLIKIPQH